MSDKRVWFIDRWGRHYSLNVGERLVIDGFGNYYKITMDKPSIRTRIRAWYRKWRLRRRIKKARRLYMTTDHSLVDAINRGEARAWELSHKMGASDATGEKTSGGGENSCQENHRR